MARINFDPELMKNIKIIYGDANLDGRTLKQLYQTWKTNPEIIKRTAQQKMPELKMASFNIQSSTLPNSLKMQTQEIADDDLSRISSFGEAFNIARQKNLTTFIWKKTKANPSGLYAVITDSNKPTTKLIQKSKTPVKQNVNTAEQSQNPPLATTQKAPQPDYQINIKVPDLATALIGKTWGKGLPTIIGENQIANKQNEKTEQSQNQPLVNSTQDAINRSAMQNTILETDFGINRALKKVGRTIGSGFMDFLNFLNEKAANNQYSKNRRVNPLGYYQQGGQMNNQQQEVQGGVMAKFGAKLEYIKKLKGICPEGYELKFFKQGGSVCKVCEKGEKLKQYPKLTNDKYRKLPTSKQSDVDLKDQARKDKCGAKLKKKKK